MKAQASRGGAIGNLSWRQPVQVARAMLPLIVPPIILVFGHIKLFNSSSILPLTNSTLGTDILIVCGYVTLSLPYMYRAIDTGLQAIDVITLTEAAQSMGAGWPTILFKVIFPNLRAALLSGSFLTLAMVMGEFTMASFLVGINAFGPYMSLVGQNKTYESSALAIISFALTWIFMGLLQRFGRGAKGQSEIMGAR